MSIPPSLVERLRSARHVFVLTGSGASAESGVPTFRDAQDGLWAEFDPMQLATPEAFARDPALVWRWYRWRRELVGKATPNPGHVALAHLAELVPALTLVTQNVDGLHQSAGSKDVVEFHGNLFVNRCNAPDCGALHPDSDEAIPKCPYCGEKLRPGVVWFGENIPAAALEAAANALRTTELFFAIGTSATVWPAAGMAETARQQGAMVVEVNPDATPITSNADHAIAAKSGEWLPELVNCLTA